MTWSLGSASAKGDPQKKYLEDACAYVSTPEGFMGVMADGAGSAPHSAKGAQFVVEEGLKLLQSLSFQAFESEIVSLCTQLREGLKNITPILDDCACTALFFVMWGDTLFLAQVGDGFVVTGHNGHYTLQMLGEKGEYLNETRFITDTKLVLKTATIKDPMDFIAIGTDGLEGVAIDRLQSNPFKGFFKPFADYLKTSPSQEELDQELQSFLTSERLSKRTRDDRTLFVGGV